MRSLIRIGNLFRLSTWAVLVGLFALILGQAPAFAAVTTINVTADSLKYFAGSPVTPTLTFQTSGAVTSGNFDMTCAVYANSDTGYTTPLDVTAIVSPATFASPATYKTYCKSASINATLYTLGTNTAGVLTVYPSNSYSCNSTFYQLSSGTNSATTTATEWKLDAASGFSYSAMTTTGLVAINAAGWDTENNYIYGLNSATVLAQVDAAGNNITNTIWPVLTPGSSARYAPSHVNTTAASGIVTTSGDFYTINGQSYLITGGNSTSVNVIDVRTRSLVKTYTLSASYTPYDFAFVGNTAYGVNGTTPALQSLTVSGTDPANLTFTVGTAKNLTPASGTPSFDGSSSSFGAAYADSDGNIFAFENDGTTSGGNKLYQIPKAQLTATNPQATLIKDMSGVSPRPKSPNDGASCPTAASPTAATVTTSATVTSITTSSASVSGTVSTPNVSGADIPSNGISFCYATSALLLTTSATCTTASPSTLAQNTASTSVSAGLSGLSPGTVYYFRTKATNSAGSSGFGETRTFTTLNAWTLTAQSQTYSIGGTVPTLTAAASPVGGLNGTTTCAAYASSDASYSSALTISSLSAGSYVIHCTGAAASGYGAGTLVNGTLTVTALNAWSITASNATYQTPGTPPTAMGAASPSGGLSGSLTCDFYTAADTTYSSPMTLSSSTAAGTYVVHCSGTAAAGYAPASNNNGVLTVTNSSWRITAPNVSYTIGSGSLPTLTGTASPAGALSGSTSCSVYTQADTTYATVLTIGDGLASGTYVTRCTGTAATGYQASATLVNGTLLVTSLNSWTLAAANQSYTVGGAVPSLTSTATPSGGMSGSATCNVYASSDTTYAAALTINSSLAAGTYVIHCTATSATGYAAPAITNGVLTVSVTYTVTFDANGGSGSIASQTSSSATALTSNSGAISWSGYTFTGWNTQSGGGGTPYADAESYPFTSSTTLYAQWSASSNTVTFDGQGGTTPSALPFLTGGSITLPFTSRSGYTFNGWFTTSASGTNVGGSSSSYSPSGSQTLYAKWTAATYNVNYNSQGGSSVTGSTYTWGNSVTLASAPTWTGHTFNGWFLAGTGGSALGATHTPGTPGAITYYAQWTPVSYTVTYNSQGGSSASSATYTYGSSALVLPTTTRDGYTFTGWYTAGSGGTNEGIIGDNYTPTSSTTLYAQWTANSYTVTYDPQGGSSVTGGSYTWGNSITLAAAPTWNGYSYVGWFTTSTGGSALGSTYSPSLPANLTIYAQWTANTYTVTYNTQGGSSVTGGNYTWGNSVTLPAAPTKAGYVFAGWYVASSGGSALGSSHTPGTPGNITYFAQWTIGSNTVGYDPQGGSAASSQTFSTGGSVSLQYTSRSGYTFDGWFTDPSAGTNLGSAGASYSPSGSITLYAHWTPRTYSISYDPQGGSSVTTGSTNYTWGGTVTLPSNPTRTGYTFTGWYFTSTGGSQLTTGFTPGTPGSLQIYAQWTPIVYVVTYNSQGGSSVASVNYAYGSPALSLPGSSRAGYALTGWYTTTTGGSSEGDEGDNFTPTGNVTLYAHWVAQSYSLTYNANGGSGSINSTSFTTGGPSITVATYGSISRSGYRFITWNTASNGFGTSFSPGASVTITSNTVLYAMWQYIPLPAPYVAPLPFTTPTPTPFTPRPSGQNLAVPAPSVVAAATKVTLDAGNGATSNNKGVTPIEAALTTASATKSVNQLQSETVSGFSQGSSVTIKVSGAKTTGQFVVSNANSIDTVSVAAALKESQNRTATEFAQITAANPVTTVDWSKVTTGSVTSDATDLFKASGLGAPRTLADLPTTNASHWVDINAKASGYVPGSVVYLAVTTEPIIFGSAQVDLNGEVTLDGLLPVDVLEPAAHSIRIVGTRDLGGVTVDKDGHLILANSTMEQIQRFDKGTNAVVEMYGSSAEGAHAAVRLVPLNMDVPWWLLWIFIGLLVIAFIIRRRTYPTKKWLFVMWGVGIVGVVAIEIVAWVGLTYILLPWAPLAALVVLGGDALISAMQRGWRFTHRRPRHG